MRKLSIATPGGPLEYTITHRSRVIKRMHMELDERGGLVVVAPRHWSKRQVGDVLRQNTPRVLRFLHRARQRHMEPLQFTQGELHLYLGSLYPLSIQSASVCKAAVNFTGVDFRVRHPQKTGADIQSMMLDWYRKQALSVFNQRLQVVSDKAAWARDRVIPLKVRKMKRTWGNCSSSGVIKLNTHLVKAPLRLIDSVIAHELCHLKEMNHSRAFYQLLETLNPDWRQDRKTLVSEGNSWLR